MEPRHRYVVIYAPRVLADVSAALEWWAVHRDKTPGLLADELEHALNVIAASPHLGQRAQTQRFGQLLRFLLPRTRYHLYYRIIEDELRVELVQFRHAQMRPVP